MQHKPKPLKPALMLMLLALLTAACSSPSTITRPNTPPLLPAAGRVSLIQTPSECLPTCSAGLARVVNESADMLMK